MEVLVHRAVLLQRLDRRVSESLEQERGEVERLAGGRDPQTGEPFDGDAAAVFDTFLRRNLPAPGEVYLTFVDGQPYRRSLSPLAVALDAEPALMAQWASLERGERGEIATSEGPVRYLAVALRSGNDVPGVFVVTNFLRAERSEIYSDIRLRAVGLGVVTALGLGAAWLTAGRLLRPLRDTTEAARSISETDLSRRIPVEGHDEIAEMATTFNQMLDRLEDAFAAQRTFIDDAGHELRTPITVISGQLELMGDSPEERAQTLAVVEDELARMARIVEDLLLLAKAEQGDFIRYEAIELADFTTELLMKARSLGSRDWQLDACAVGGTELDGQRVTQAVLNLVRNAVEHTEPGAPIGIGSARSDGVVKFWVRDEGPGIAPEEQVRMFGRFSRGRDERRSSEGAGLGLAIVAAIASAHQGAVAVRSDIGRGATFMLELPDRAGSDGLDAADPEPSQPGNSPDQEPDGAPSPPEVPSDPPREDGDRWCPAS